MSAILETLALILLLGFFGGQLARRLGAPALIGMILVGIVLGPAALNLLQTDVLTAAPTFRTVAVMVILMKAGLGLDRQKLAQQGTVALRLGVLPALCEMVVVAGVAMLLLGFDLRQGLLLGAIVAPESPAVIVPGMLRLKSLGWGVDKGISDAILSGSAISDVVILLLFSLLMGSEHEGGFLGALPPALGVSVQALLEIGGGLIVGYGLAWALVFLLVKQNWSQNRVQTTLVAAAVALGAVGLADRLPLFSGYLAVMSAGFFLIEMDAPLARQLRGGFDVLWQVAEIFLFVLLGASVQLGVLQSSLGVGLVILAVGTLIGRGIGWYLSTLGSHWTLSERLFLLPGNSAKATVQAAIGALPLSAGVAGGETMLAIAVLSILITAPLGAWAIPTFAPKLLQKGEVDATKVLLQPRVVLLAPVDVSSVTPYVLQKTAELARRADAEVIVLHVQDVPDPKAVATLEAQVKQYLADIRYRFIVTAGPIPQAILDTATLYNVTEIILGKHGQGGLKRVLMGSVCQSILETSTRPVLIVEEPRS
ncbi:cation:proton antiporter [Thermosynechococcus sp. PP45]|uniref:cation:proton antiporter n=1 Tax=unclassified Thermosynechococcus TaxID=2622553 RepID=UPI0026710C73|nr:MULTISPECIES: cation:proton antiporter [unclassified Thermosynechococcus]WKT80158.1 cation:proton antiporter [Thermosynechococcus sp. PP45]WNC23768.1 cation:proton antiporter [Thermosynechococcus sp. PP551]WNC26344.1 cation:proton antiporter [Thermosynechococcus sp. PP555]